MQPEEHFEKIPQKENNIAEMLLDSPLYIPFKQGEENTRVYQILTLLKIKLNTLKSSKDL